MYSPNPYGPSQPLAQSTAGTLPGAVVYLRKVYSLFAGGIAFAIVGALVALYAGGPAVEIDRGGIVSVPPIVAFELEHFLFMVILYFGAFFAASWARRMPGINLLALFAYTFITGLFLAPPIFVAMAQAAAGATLDASPVRDAFLLTGAAFTGLTAYVFVTKKDFSYLGASLMTGLWVIIGASILGIFFHSAVLQLAIASVGVLLFAGYILYDTSRLLQDREEREPVGAALRLFLDVVNMFIFLLRILSSARQQR